MESRQRRDGPLGMELGVHDTRMVRRKPKGRERHGRRAVRPARRQASPCRHGPVALDPAVHALARLETHDPRAVRHAREPRHALRAVRRAARRAAEVPRLSQQDAERIRTRTRIPRVHPHEDDEPAGSEPEPEPESRAAAPAVYEHAGAGRAARE